jgi:predicted TIM-barrel fold metal-dependent hydrolase
LLYDPAIYAAAVRAVGAERILFGSDYPLMVFPKEQREPDFARMLAHVRAAGLDDAALTASCGGNARRVLGMAG